MATMSTTVSPSVAGASALLVAGGTGAGQARGALMPPPFPSPSLGCRAGGACDRLCVLDNANPVCFNGVCALSNTGVGGSSELCISGVCRPLWQRGLGVGHPRPRAAWPNPSCLNPCASAWLRGCIPSAFKPAALRRAPPLPWAGWGNCDSIDSNGCETNTNTNATHCARDCSACSWLGRWHTPLTTLHG